MFSARIILKKMSDASKKIQNHIPDYMEEAAVASTSTFLVGGLISCLASTKINYKDLTLIALEVGAATAAISFFGKRYKEINDLMEIRDDELARSVVTFTPRADRND